MGLSAVRACEATALWDAAYAAATVELFSRLWDELEKLNNTARSSDARAPIETRLLALRLELHLLVETCDSARWRAMLAPTQRAELRLLIDRVLSAIAVSPIHEAVVAQAQNILFDAVLDLCRRLP